MYYNAKQEIKNKDQVWTLTFLVLFLRFLLLLLGVVLEFAVGATAGSR